MGAHIIMKAYRYFPHVPLLLMAREKHFIIIYIILKTLNALLFFNILAYILMYVCIRNSELMLEFFLRNIKYVATPNK